MSTTALHIVELVRSLPPDDQRTIRAELAKSGAAGWESGSQAVNSATVLERDDADGIPNDHPFFQILEEYEAARRRDFGPAAPEFD